MLPIKNTRKQLWKITEGIYKHNQNQTNDPRGGKGLEEKNRQQTTIDKHGGRISNGVLHFWNYTYLCAKACTICACEVETLKRGKFFSSSSCEMKKNPKKLQGYSLSESFI